MREPYRVIVWGPGTLGRVNLRNVLVLPEFELAGVLVYSEAKEGKDAVDLVPGLKLESTGVTATRDQEAILAMDADVVLHTPTDRGDFSSREDIVRLLESGKNVITALPYHFPQLRGPELVERLEEACNKGGTSFHATGSDPGFIGERLVITLTGICNEIEHIKLEEFFNVGKISREGLTRVGFGSRPENAGNITHLAKWSDNYLRQVVAHAGVALGVDFDRIEQRTETRVTPDDLSLEFMDVKAGTIGAITNSWTGYAGDKPFYTLNTYWYMSEATQPFKLPFDADHFWRISVEGRPSVRLSMEMKASVEHDTTLYEGDPTSPDMMASAVPMVQAIPVVCSAPPGIVQSSVWAHWMQDLRGLANQELPS